MTELEKKDLEHLRARFFEDDLTQRMIALGMPKEYLAFAWESGFVTGLERMRLIALPVSGSD